MSHPRGKKLHSECLLLSCLVCLRKADRQISAKKDLLSFIVNNKIQDFENVKHHLPSGLCSTCRQKDIAKIDFPDYSRWIDILSNLSVASRSSPDCQCFVCVNARTKIPKKSKQKRGPKSSP